MPYGNTDCDFTAGWINLVNAVFLQFLLLIFWFCSGGVLYSPSRWDYTFASEDDDFPPLLD